MNAQAFEFMSRAMQQSYNWSSVPEADHASVACPGDRSPGSERRHVSR